MTALHIAIRADAGPTIGFGHVMRCITLGTALIDRGHRVSLVSRNPVESLMKRCKNFGIAPVEIPPSTDDASALKALRADLVIFDGYHLADSASTFYEHGIRWMGVDDNRELPIATASAVLNHNLFANDAMYPELAAEQIWTGPEFALLRNDLTALERHDAQPPIANQIVLSMGGADPLDLSKVLALGIAESPNTTVRVATNAARRSHKELAAVVAQHSQVEFATANLIETFRVSDIAVIGAGTTLWETAYLGIPTVALVTADNQEDGARSAARAGIAIMLDARDRPPDVIVAQVAELASDRQARVEMMRRGHDLFDGKGPHRVARRIETLLG